jgi:hypothetical protein
LKSDDEVDGIYGVELEIFGDVLVEAKLFNRDLEEFT